MRELEGLGSELKILGSRGVRVAGLESGIGVRGVEVGGLGSGELEWQV